MSNSETDPWAINKNLINSLFDSRAAPSDIFEGIEIAERLICEVNPNNSSFGNDFVFS